MAEAEKPHADADKHHGHWKLKFHWHHSHDAPHETVGHKSKEQRRPLDFTKDIPTNLPYPPFVNVVGVPNFRDVGGYSCPAPPHAGAEDAQAPWSVRKGYLFRCSELSQITPEANVLLVEDLKVKTLFDFRSEREAANLRGHPHGVNCISTPVFRKDDITYSLSVQQLRWATEPDKSPSDGYSQGYVDWYRHIALYGAKFAFRQCFEYIRDNPDAPFLIHCSAGKDRTGVFSALVLNLCGVADATVAWEYALTVPGMGIWETAVEQEMVGDSMMPIRSHGGMTREEAHRLCGSRASNMAKWLEIVLNGELGGTAKYLKDHAQFSDEDIEKIRKNLIVREAATVKPVEVPGMEDHPQT